MDPVIVVGAGPVGLTLALALARLDVPSVLVDEGPGTDPHRPARTVLLREDTAALVERLTRTDLSTHGCRLSGLRTLRRKQELRPVTFGDENPAPLHLAQNVLTTALRAALAAERLVTVVTDSRLDALEQESAGLTAHTRGRTATWWRGSYLVGCDGPGSTVRKLIGVRFPGRTAVERHAVAALRTELPWQNEALLHRTPPWRGAGTEISGRPLPGNVWRLDWLLPSRDELVTPESLLARVRQTLAGWNGGETPAYELLDTGVHTVHHRLARRWRVGRVFLAGNAAHLLGALGTHGLDEGLRDADNLAWKLALAWHHGAAPTLLDSYQAERRAAVSTRLRSADQALPLVRGTSALRALVPARSHDALLTEGHLGLGAVGSPSVYRNSPLTPASSSSHCTVDTAVGAPVADVTVTAEDGTFVRLRQRLGHGALLVLLVAPGTGVWERKHWMSAGLMPRLSAAVAALPAPAELLVAETYPGAPAHSVLLIRPDGYLVAAFSGVHPQDLKEAAEAALGIREPGRDAEQEAGNPGGGTGVGGGLGVEDRPGAGAGAGVGDRPSAAASAGVGVGTGAADRPSAGAGTGVEAGTRHGAGAGAVSGPAPGRGSGPGRGATPEREAGAGTEPGLPGSGGPGAGAEVAVARPAAGRPAAGRPAAGRPAVGPGGGGDKSRRPAPRALPGPASGRPEVADVPAGRKSSGTESGDGGSAAVSGDAGYGRNGDRGTPGDGGTDYDASGRELE